MDNLIKEMQENLTNTVQSHKHYKSTKNIGSGVIMATHILKLKEAINKTIAELNARGVDTSRIEVK